jgi:hypothetical protein
MDDPRLANVRVQDDAVRVGELRRAHRTRSTGTPSRSATSPEFGMRPVASSGSMYR